MPESTPNLSTADISDPSSAAQLEVEDITPPDSASDIQLTKDKTPDIGFVPLQDFMGISNPDDDQKDKLSFIWEYFSKGRTRVDTLEAIKEAKRSLSEPEIGENHLHKLYSYTRLLEQSRDIEKEKKLYQR